MLTTGIIAPVSLSSELSSIPRISSSSRYLEEADRNNKRKILYIHIQDS